MFGLFKRQPKEPGIVRIEPLGVELPVPGNQSVLQAALEAGIDFPHSCKVGTCMACRSRLREGKVKAIRDFSYVLSAEELKAGYILACQAKVAPGERIVLEVEIDSHRPHHPQITTQGRITAQTPLTHDIVELCVALDQPLAYTAGQYAALRTGDIARAREYSFARAPTGADRELRFFIRLTPGGQFTGWLFERSRVGETLEVSGPGGDFWLRASDAPLVFVAGGSGLAPVLSVLEAAAGAGVARDAVFLFGARTQADLYKLDAIEAIAARWAGNFRFVPVLSHEPADSGWTGARGLVTEFLATPQVPDLAARHAYLCGPPPMIDAALRVLSAAGVADAHVHYDKFLDSSSLGTKV
jgi:NAD(P)H-flavin reductase/ferredoxin